MKFQMPCLLKMSNLNGDNLWHSIEMGDFIWKQKNKNLS